MSRRPSAPPLPPDVQASPIQPPPDDAETAAVMALSDALAGTPPPSQEARDAETAATLALADALADEPPRPPADAPFGFDGSAANETGVSLCLGDAAVGAPPGGAMSGEWNEFVLYTFYLGFGHHSWRVRLRFSDAARVFPAAARAAKASGAPLPEPPRKTWTLHEKDASVIDERSRALAAYLERVVARADTWALPDVKELFEVSPSTFDDALGPSGKEGYCVVATNAGGVNVFGPSGSRRWVVLKPRYVAFYDASGSDPRAGRGGARGVLVIDATFSFRRHAKDAREVVLDGNGFAGAVCLRFPGRDGERRAAEWAEALEATVKRSREGVACRHGSFAPRRERSARAAFYVGGREYFGALLAAVRGARRSIFLADWRIYPPLLLKRAPDGAPASLEAALAARVAEGVDVYVLLYREFSESLQAKHRSGDHARSLRALSRDGRGRVYVLRHPRHLSAGQVFWSHHEKVCVVDQRVAFVGGMDLCEGRYDDLAHGLRDDCEPHRWPGAEYYQPNAPRNCDDGDDRPRNVDVDRRRTPRLPWQDVAAGVDGGAALDVALHFCARWNHHRVALRRPELPLLLPHSDGPRPGLKARSGTSYDGDSIFEGPACAFIDGTCPLPRDAPVAAAVQVVRSVGRWSLGAERRETSAHAAWCDAIANAERFLYVEQQFWITSLDEDAARWEQSAAPVDGAVAVDGEGELVPIVVPPGFGPGDAFAVPLGGDRVVSVVVPPGCGPGSALQLRTAPVEPANAPGNPATPSRGLLARGAGFVGDVARAAGAAYGDATTAFTSGVRNRVGHALLERLRRAIGNGETFRALVVLPLHPNGRFLDSEEVHGVMQQQFCSVCRGPGSLLGKLAAEFPEVDLDRYVKFCCLRTFQDLDAGPASEMVYVHSKLLVADDAVAIVGSANVNDRSLLGDRDTEVCLVVEDRAAVRDLRLKLLRAHLGMEPLPGHGTPHVDHFDRPHHRKWDDDLDDLDSPRVWQTILDVVALNTQLLEAAFDDVPWDDVATLADAKAALGLSAVSRHVRSPPGTDGWRNEVRAVHNTLSGVKGELCAFPTDFLRGETLAPSLLAKLFVGRRLFQ